jgi:hypothetical protein
LKQFTSLFLAGLMFVTLSGCTGGDGNQQVADNRSVSRPPRQQGMSTKQKLVLLAGAAALAYMYSKHKNKQGAGKEGQYYRSKNGRVYYRDANGKAIWVTPPSQGISVPQDQADLYRSQARDFEYAAPGPAGY